MKKSEMENILIEYIKPKVLTPICFSWGRLANNILKLCENNGMLPPERVHYYDADAEVRGEGYKRDRTWKPEDE